MVIKHQEEARLAFHISTGIAVVFVISLFAVIAWAKGGAA